MRGSRTLVDQAALEALAIAGQQAGAPVTIPALAEALNLEVADLPIAQDGRLYIYGDSAQVVINSEEPLVRRRFTFAHEAAHWLLHGPILDEDLKSRLRRSYDSEEYLCDKLAGALLLPLDWVLNLADEPRDLTSLRAIASQAEVSLSATLVRLRDVLGWRQTLYQWAKDGSHWVLTGEAGLLPSQQGMLRTTEETELELERLASRDMSVDGLGARFGNSEMRLLGEVTVNPHTRQALALLGLPDVCDLSGRRRRRFGHDGVQRIQWTIA
jgi:IrrE N-terminal-like domain